MYNIYLESSAEKDLKKLPPDFMKIVVKNIKELSGNPRPANCKKLIGIKNFWRIRAGNYRIVYEIIDSSNRINVYRTNIGKMFIDNNPHCKLPLHYTVNNSLHLNYSTSQNNL